jgi:hypothetical protein
MELNYTAISTWAAVGAVLIAVIGLWLEAKRTAVSRGVDTLMKYSSEFSSKEFMERRLHLAKILIKKMDRKLNKREEMELVAYATYFLDHYEVIGFLLRKKILDKQLVYVYYCFTLMGYWRFLKEVIDSCRLEDPMLWEDAEWLHAEFAKIYGRRAPGAESDFLDDKVRKFLAAEIS